jgi:hypothetical protein
MPKPQTSMRETSKDRKTHAHNEQWEALDYSEKDNYDIINIVSNKKVNAKTIQQIIHTGKLDHGVYMACQHKLAHAEDIIEFIHRTDSSQLDTYYIDLYDDIIYNMLHRRREQVNVYLKKLYDLNVESMTTNHIQEMLNIPYLGTFATAV